MTTYNTGNALGSTDPRDLYDNAENFDNLANGSEPSYNDRLGNTRKSIAGMDAEFTADQSARATTFQSFISSSGYEFLGDYAASIEVTAYNQVIRESGEFWKPAAGTSLPYTTTGAGMPESGAFVSVGDANLRQEVGGGVRRVGDLSSLEGISGRFSGDVAYMVGRTTAGDGGEGEFRWDGSDLSSTLVLASITSTSVDDTTDTITSAGHGLVDGNGVVTTTAVNGLTANQVYWVVNATTDTFQLSATFGGAAADLTGTTNFTVEHLIDPLKGVYVTATDDPAGINGVWVRQDTIEIYGEWFGAVGDWNGSTGTDNSSAIQSAVDFAKFDTNFGRSGAQTLHYDGSKEYMHSIGVIVDGGSVCIDMHGGSFVYTGSGIGLYSGNTDYLTNISAGYYQLALRNSEVKATNVSAVCIQNDGFRILSFHKVYTSGGDIGFRTEGAFGGAVISHSYFQGAASIGADIRQRNNLMTINNSSVLGVTSGPGWVFSQTTAENDSIYLSGCDAEGCTDGYKFETGIGPITLENCWGENNTRSIYVSSTSDGNTNGIQIYGGQYDADIDFGDVGGSGTLRGCKIDGVKLTNGNLNVNVDTGVQVGFNVYSGTSVLAFADGQTLQPTGLDGYTSAEIMPRYKSGHVVPFATSDTKGIDGDIRWDDSRSYIKTSSTEWRMSQTHEFDTDSLPALGTGASVNVAGLKMCRTANGGATTVTTITGEYAGQELIIVGNDGGNTTISASAVKLPGGANITLGDNDVLHIICMIPSIDLWTTVSYSDNPA